MPTGGPSEPPSGKFFQTTPAAFPQFVPYDARLQCRCSNWWRTLPRWPPCRPTRHSSSTGGRWERGGWIECSFSKTCRLASSAIRHHPIRKRRNLAFWPVPSYYSHSQKSKGIGKIYERTLVLELVILARKWLKIVAWKVYYGSLRLNIDGSRS